MNREATSVTNIGDVIKQLRRTNKAATRFLLECKQIGRSVFQKRYEVV